MGNIIFVAFYPLLTLGIICLAKIMLPILKLLAGLRVMVFNAAFNNISAISWRSVLFVVKTGVPG